MKKLVFILTTLVLIAACTGTSKDSEDSKDTVTSVQQDNLTILEFKIDGLQDSIISDSIWRIIMQMEGVSQVVLSKVDSMAVFEVNPELVSTEMLEEEIQIRGGVLVN